MTFRSKDLDESLDDQEVFQITIWYFKPNGKFYAGDTFGFRPKRRGYGSTCPMNDVAAQVRGWRDNGGQGSMPGLDDYSAGWDGLILLNCDEGFPILLPPLEPPDLDLASLGSSLGDLGKKKRRQ